MWMEGAKWERSEFDCGSLDVLKAWWRVLDFKTYSADYHDQMKTEHFMEWFAE